MNGSKMMWHHSFDEPGKMLLIGLRFPYEEHEKFSQLISNNSIWYLFVEMGEFGYEK